MITLPLSVRHASQPRHKPAAWLIPGADARQWLDELTAWQVPLADVSLCVVPTSPGDLRPRAVLAIPPAGNTPRVSRRCRPYGRVAERLYVPAEARFEPEVSASELAALLGPHVYVIHPVVGLIAFESADVLRGGDLLQAPTLREENWGWARPGVAFNGRLRSIMPEHPPSLESIMQQGRDDIGSQAGEIESLPPTPDEPSQSATGRSGRGASRALARMVLWFTQKVPGGATDRTWINGLEDWASRQMHRVDAALEHLRHKELNRLLHLLQSDPDEGLRHAIGVGGDAHRGLAPPSSRLGQHDVEFNLHGSRGGGPADFWDVPFDVQQRLTARYRELADRELRLGRHRRAAYIYAELLGDVQMAAVVLKQGQHWRDAAVLFRDKLNRPREAAACLEEGGLLSEAIEIYEKLGEFVKVGDLHTKLGQEDDAEESYRRAVDQHVTSGDYLKAAGLLETKLNSPDESLQLLDSTWPHTAQAAKCLDASFALRGRLGRHDEAEKKVLRLRNESIPSGHAILLADALANVAVGYPDRNVKNQAADAARVVAAARLPLASPVEADRILGAVRRLVPEDRLLGRDCQRFAQQASQSATKPAARKRTPSPASPVFVREFALPTDVKWRWFTSVGGIFYAAGWREKELVVVRSRWDGIYQKAAARPGVDYPHRCGQLLAYPRQGEPLLVYMSGADGAFTMRFSADDHFRGPLDVILPGWLPPSILGAARAPNGTVWVYAFDDGQQCDVLYAFSPNGELLTTRQIPQMPDTWEFVADDLPNGLFPMVVRNERVYLAIGRHLVTVHLDGQPESLELADGIRSLTAAAPHSRTRLAATFEEGGVVYWGEYDGDHLERFGGGLRYPVAGFTLGGHLVAAATGECQVYRTSQRRLELAAVLNGLPGVPWAVLATSAVDEFALGMPDGRVLLYRVPGGNG